MAATDARTGRGDRRWWAPAARTRLALGATRLGGSLSRLLGAGSGSVVGGRIGLLIEPDLLRLLAAGRRVVVVSGTNGKTTTTRLVAEALRASGQPVASSEAGANMPEGMVAALAAAPAPVVAALEADEAYLPAVLAATRPEVVVLLNLSRDQLDRTSEVRMLAARWRRGLAGLAGTVVANADDPLVVWATGAGAGGPAGGGPAGGEPAKVLFVGVGSAWRDDAHHCPACDARIGFDGGSWSCSSCGLRRPETVAELVGDELVAAGGSRRTLALALPGRFNRANAALALVAATAMGVGESQAAAALAAVREIAGRFADVAAPGGRARLLLAKNPAGWAELLELLREGSGPLVISINARLADGHDPSWLWDVPFELLEGRFVVATGERRLDLAVRLLHAGVGHEVVADPLAALGRATALSSSSRRGGGSHGGDSSGRVDAVGNYTAFQDLRQLTGAAGSGAICGSPPVPVAAAAPRPVVTGRPAGAARRLGGESALRIVVVHPDLLGTYGDGGNGQVLADRAAWRGFASELVLARSDRPVPRSGDLYCLGGGEDGPQARSCSLLADGSLAAAVDAGAVVLAVCAGFQIVGNRFPGADGSAIAGLGLLDVTTRRQRRPRAVGEIVAVTLASQQLLAPGLLLSGFENHASTTTLGPAATPLARVRTGTGNDGGGLEGAVAGRVVGTYLHGPVLARNPALADALLALVIGIGNGNGGGGGNGDGGGNGGGGGLAPLEDGEEQALLAERLRAAAPASAVAPAGGRGAGGDRARRGRRLERAATFIEQLAKPRV